MSQTENPTRPPDATLTVTRAARLLGVHPNTVRAWSDQGRLRYYRINRRGDRRYRLGDLQRFLAGTQPPPDGAVPPASPRTGSTWPDRREPAGPGGSLPGDLTTTHPDLGLVAHLSGIIATGRELDATLTAAARLLRDGWALAATGVWERLGGRLVPRAMVGAARPFELPETFGVLGLALENDRAVLADPASARDVALILGRGPELATPITGPDGAWGVLWLAAEATGGLAERELAPAEAAAEVIAAAVRAGRLADEVVHQLHRADALRRVADDIGSRLDLDQILSGLVDHAMVLFEADRAAVYLRQPGGRAVAAVSRGLSSSYLAATCGATPPSLADEADLAGRPVFAMGYRDDPRATAIRAAVVQEGFDTLCTAPLRIGDRSLGSLDVHHDTPHPWSPEELETMRAFAAQASVAIKAAQDVGQMATWAAQLQSIQQLGARLNRLTSVGEIGMAIATELRQLIDYHNVRVYRIRDTALVPVAMLGQVGEYVDETPEMLRVAVGEGITGWVAEHGVAQYLPDAARDPRAQTIPGTDDDLAESMLLAPMVFEDTVLGVVVLSKLGVDQFSDDDLRLLVIYASFAAQAMANADATERLRAQSEALERQLERQRQLLRLTESMLTTLDRDALLDQVTGQLGALVRCDDVFVDLIDPGAGRLRSARAIGSHAAARLADREADGSDVADWVAEHNEPVLITGERDDPRALGSASTARHAASLVVVPLRDRGGVSGVLTVERLPPEPPFSTDESELIQLFAAQVSIALQNATVHTAVEVRARTDDLTGLLNHGAFEAWLAAAVAAGDPFSLIMVDLDDFKGVNDALGHQAGDQVLRAVAGAITGAARASDPVFRYGGDEFVVCLPGATAAAALTAAERIRTSVRAVGDESSWRDRGVRMGTSIGYASFPRDGRTAEDVLLAADRACYVAKRSGRGLIITAETGRELAADSALQEPTPVDPPSPAGAA